MSTLHDYYEFLEISPDASQEEIKKAYRRLVRVFHPDTTDDPQARIRFHQIQEAYDVLSSEEKREQYDAIHRRFDGRDEKITLYKKTQADVDVRRNQQAPDGDSAKHAADAEAARRWRTLRSYHGSTLEADKEGDAEQGFARAPGTDSISPTHPERPSMFQKLKESVTGNRKPQRPVKSPRSGAAPLERPRVFQFSLNALESLSESHREIALQGSDVPRIIRVKIPAGVADNTVLKVHCPETDDYPAKTIEVRVRIEPHQFVERNGNDITLKIPVTVHEALTGAEIEVPTLRSPVRVRIPTPWTPNGVVKLSGHGTRGPNGKTGDIYVTTYIVLPEAANESARQAAQVIDESYTGSVRRHVPLLLDRSSK